MNNIRRYYHYHIIINNQQPPNTNKKKIRISVSTVVYLDKEDVVGGHHGERRKHIRKRKRLYIIRGASHDFSFILKL